MFCLRTFCWGCSSTSSRRLKFFSPVFHRMKWRWRSWSRLWWIAKSARSCWKAMQAIKSPGRWQIAMLFKIFLRLLQSLALHLQGSRFHRQVSRPPFLPLHCGWTPTGGISSCRGGSTTPSPKPTWSRWKRNWTRWVLAPSWYKDRRVNTMVPELLEAFTMQKP